MEGIPKKPEELQEESINYKTVVMGLWIPP
jgi:hypothetical protein